MSSAIFNRLSKKLGRIIKQTFIPGDTSYTTNSGTFAPVIIYPPSGLVKQNNTNIKVDFYFMAILTAGITSGVQYSGKFKIEYSEDNQVSWLPLAEATNSFCFQSDDYGSYSDSPSNGTTFHLTFLLTNLTTNLLHIRVSNATTAATFYFPYNTLSDTNIGDFDPITPENNIERFVWSFTFTELMPN